MSHTAVVNASPLIHLARADLFDLLRLAGDDVIVADTVLADRVLDEALVEAGE